MNNPEQFKILSARDHVRTRPGMYLGSTSCESTERFVNGNWETTYYVPAIFKMIEEIIDNSIDEAIRTNFKFANLIEVEIDGDSILITDNGRGIPINDVTDCDGNKILRPVASWTKSNAGTSFSEDRNTIGANGVGSACTNFLSKHFIGSTWSEGKKIVVECEDGANKITVTKYKRGDKLSGTSVKFIPDFNLFEVDSLSDNNNIIEKLVEDRLASIQVAFPKIKTKFNRKFIKQNNFTEYAKHYTDSNSSIVYISPKGSTSSVDGFFTSSVTGNFRTTSYINGVNTRFGGSYVDYVLNGVCESLIAIIKKRHKIDVNRSLIKNGLTFVLFARDFKNPQYDSQTKERLTSNSKDVKNHYSGNDFEKIAKGIMACEDIIMPIIDAQLAKKVAAEKRAEQLASKKLKRIKVAKHISASDPPNSNTTLYLCEGDSAIGYLLKVRDPQKIGGYPLRGIVMNTWNMKPHEVLKNKELSELISVLGLDITKKNNLDDLTYDNIAILTDADHDGIGHIMPLLLAFFYQFWSRLFEEGRIHINRTPILISEKKGKKSKWFYDYDSATQFKNSEIGQTYSHRYIKGLASHTESEYSEIVNNPNLFKVNIDEPEWFEVAFGDDVQKRKDWLTESNINDK